MKKIMFNDRFGLTQAVLEGKKTMTRRMMTMTLHKKNGKEFTPVVPDDMFMLSDGMAHFQIGGKDYIVPKKNQPAYHVGEEVAVAQSYEDAILDVGEEEWNKRHKWYCIENLRKREGLHNKMFVQSDLMPHRIRITNIKVERLQDISEEDCLREGIQSVRVPDGCVYVAGGKKISDDDRKRILSGELELAKQCVFLSPTTAFAALIDRISGRGTWNRNPWVYVYTFELIK